MTVKENVKPNRVRRFLTWGVGAIFSLLIVGAIYQQVATSADQEKYPPYGELVQVGDHKLHIHCIGQGSPTIIVDNGGGNWSITWLELQERLAEKTRVCVYDRAGLGSSEPGPMPRTSDVMVNELHQLLQNANVPQPYVLVGHSLGGYNARIYQDRYPNEVAGIALVEAGHEEQWSRLPQEISDLVDEQIMIGKIGRALSYVGLLRLIAPPELKQLPPDLRAAHTAAMVTPKTLNAIIAEVESAEISANQLGQTGSLGDLPLVVVSARYSNNAFAEMAVTVDIPFEEADLAWFGLQEELVTLSSNSQHFVSEVGTHDINFDDPDLVVEAINQLLVMIEANR
ncbi:MAG: alpha/beta fold hydrolase [Anaerolineae bacterium]